MKIPYYHNKLILDNNPIDLGICANNNLRSLYLSNLIEENNPLDFRNWWKMAEDSRDWYREINNNNSQKYS